MSPAQYFAKINILGIFDMLPVGVAMLNLQGQVIYYNKKLAKLTGFELREATGLPCRHFLKTKLCVSGCHLGCMAFSYGVDGRSTKKELPNPVRVEDLADTIASLQGGQETDMVSLQNQRIPLRLTHFPVVDAENHIVFYLDIVEDLRELKTATMRLHQSVGNESFIGKSLVMERIIEILPNIATSNAPVLLTGETGTGKDLLAETLHQSSHRSREAFVRARINHLPENLLYEELFGTGGDMGVAKQGYFQQAHGGTLYITELADIPKQIQAQLINYLDSGAIIPAGANKSIPLNVRLITATNQEQGKLLSDGIILPELYYRLNLGHLHLPPLRERTEDIDFLIEHFLKLFTDKFKKNITGFAQEVRSILYAHQFLGNVRELRNIVEYAVMVCCDDSIKANNLPTYLTIAPIPQSSLDATRKDTKKRKSNAPA